MSKFPKTEFLQKFIQNFYLSTSPESLETHNVSQEIEDLVSPYIRDFDENESDDDGLSYDLALTIISEPYTNLYATYTKLKALLLQENPL